MITDTFILLSFSTNGKDFLWGIDRVQQIILCFFSHRCGHCKRLAPEFEVAATRLKGIVALAKVLHHLMDFDGLNGLWLTLYCIDGQTNPNPNTNVSWDCHYF